MSSGWAANANEIRTHAANIETVRGRFDAVRAASAHIAADDAAYGLLCGWISGILEDRHKRQDELIAYIDENLAMAVERLHTTGGNYESTDADSADSITRVDRRLTR